MALSSDEVETLLISGKELTDDDEVMLMACLREMTLKQLKLLAKKLNIKLTGSSKKSEVIDRMFAMAHIGAIRGQRNSEGDDTTSVTYINEETKSLLKALPSFTSVREWSKSLSGILKDFTFMNLLVYLVYSRDKTFDMHSLKAFKSLKAYKFFYDGFVRNVWVYEFPSINDRDTALRVLYFRAFVYHSLTCDSPLEVFVALNGDTGDVYSAQCSCVSGLGQACNHIAALLFYIENHAHDEELPTDKSKTSKAMTWNQPPKKSVTPACASSMTFVKPSHGDDPEQRSQQIIKRSAFDPRQPQHRTVNMGAVNKLLESVEKSIPSTGLQQFWRGKTSDESVAIEYTESLWSHVIFCHATISSTAPSKYFIPTLADCCKYLDAMKLPLDVVQKIEAATRGQSASELWYAMRNGRLTSSRFGEILHRRSSTSSRRLVKDIMGYGGPMKSLSPAMRWGKDNEDNARQRYIHDRALVGEAMTVTSSGLHLMADKSYLGASPDGLVLCTNVDTLCNGCLEVKCPYGIDGSVTIELSPHGIVEKFGDKFFMKTREDGSLYLPHDHKYYAQVQGQMAILGIEWCDFVVYSNGEIVIDRILADLNYWDHLSEKLEQFYVQHVIPEVLSGKIFQEEYGATL